MSDRNELHRLRAENERLKRLLAAQGVEYESGQDESTPSSDPDAADPGSTDIGAKSDRPGRTASDKIRLFRSLFRGRSDVYPVHWTSSKGTSGYSPACGNEWKPGICHKPRIKCSECQRSHFLPVTDRVIYEHLTGRHTIGVYPLLKDDSCHFLAVDFDGAEWKEDARAFVDSCAELAVPASIEISRSGRGAHVWIFFSEPVPAQDARSLGTAVISRTCSRTRQLALTSYDRLFPNQDVLPRGGFGNLIALPFQRDLRSDGRTVFVDDQFTPYSDQWEFLQSLQRMSAVDLVAALASAGANHDTLDVPFFEQEETDEPWLIPPTEPQPVSGPLPESLELVLANRIFIAKEALPQALSNRLIRVAAFGNPEFHRAQAMRLPVWNKPRVIGCAENFPKHIALPRGCLDDVAMLLKKNGVRIAIQDERTDGCDVRINFRGTLRKEQKQAMDAMMEHETGVLCAPTGSGKTVVAAAMIARRDVSTLILVHRTQLMRQWSEQLASFLELPADAPGVIGGGKNRPTGQVDIAVMQTLARRDDLEDLFASYGQVIVDECHHISAFSFESILKRSSARFIMGLTATPIRRDGHQPIIFMQCGPIRHSSARPASAPADLEVVPHFIPAPEIPPDSGIQDVFRTLAHDRRRTGRIIADVISAFEAGRKILVLTQRTGHVEALRAEIGDRIGPCFVLYGRLPAKQRQAVLSELAELPKSAPHVILATGRLVGEGFDHPPLDTLILAMPISWKGTLQQYAGRLHREHEHKTDVLIHDYIEQGSPRLFRMWEKRRRGYLAMGYRIRSQDELF